LTGGGKEKAKRREKETDGVISGCDWDIKIDLKAFWEQVERLMKNEHTPIIHFCTMRFGYELIQSNPSWFRYDLVWEKTNAVGFLCANKMPMRSHENIFVFAKKGAKYNRIDTKGDFPKGGGGASTAKYLPIAGMPNSGTTKEGVRCVKSVVKFANKKGKGNHPTQKPSELYAWLIERYSNEGDTVLDPTAGSFTSVFTAHEMKRNGIGIEKHSEYFNKANEKKEALQ
jgi:site-specific DNA-methyltransferase (adenine-specific)